MKDMRPGMRRQFWTESYFYVILIFSILNVGCIHSRHILRDSSTEELDKTNEELLGKRAQMSLLRKSEKLTAENVYLSADSVYYVETKTNEQKQIAVSDVYKIATRNRGRGTVEGFVGGLVIWGGLVGTSLLLVTAFPDDPTVEDGPGGGALVYSLMVGGSALPVLGTIIGAAVGSRKIYVFNKEVGPEQTEVQQ